MVNPLPLLVRLDRAVLALVRLFVCYTTNKACKDNFRHTTPESQKVFSHNPVGGVQGKVRGGKQVTAGRRDLSEKARPLLPQVGISLRPDERVPGMTICIICPHQDG